MTLDLDPALVARVEAQAAREGTTLTRLIERVLERGLDAHPSSSPDALARPESSLEPWKRFHELGPASEGFEASVRAARAEDAAVDERRRARLDALWADDS